ncbi:MAG: hypothetical protein AAF517_26170, partial [Planctomycetota bacterium]
MSAFRVTLFAAFAAIACGCESLPSYSSADHHYYAGRTERLEEAYATSLRSHDANALVGRMKILSARLLDRDWEDAENLALDVSTRVNVYEAGRDGERDALAMTGSEASKPFHGEPYEQAMADFYLGLLRYRRGDFEGALSCFRSALNKDRGSYLIPVEKSRARRNHHNTDRFLYESDYATLEIFAAKCWSELGEAEEADKSLTRAKNLRPDLAPLFHQALNSKSNVLVLIETGRAPRKVGGGPRGAVLA